MEDRTEVPEEFVNEAYNTGRLTERQEKYLRGLLDEREIDADARVQMLARIDAKDVTKGRASDWIQRLLEKPKRAVSAGNPVGQIHVKYKGEVILDDGQPHRIGFVVIEDAWIPRGRYALDTSAGSSVGIRPTFANDTTFFKLWVGERGGWSISVQASDEEYKIDNWATKRWVIEQIAKDPEEAMRRYGRELGRCGMCGRTLTNDESRELGIGPVCRTRL